LSKPIEQRNANKKKTSKSGKGRKTYISWEDNVTSFSSSSHEEVKANMCLMAGKDYEVSSMNSNTSFNSENYSSLLQTFLETYKEANKLALSNNQLKGLNN